MPGHKGLRQEHSHPPAHLDVVGQQLAQGRHALADLLHGELQQQPVVAQRHLLNVSIGKDGLERQQPLCDASWIPHESGQRGCLHCVHPHGQPGQHSHKLGQALFQLCLAAFELLCGHSLQDKAVEF